VIHWKGVVRIDLKKRIVRKQERDISRSKEILPVEPKGCQQGEKWVTRRVVYIKYVPRIANM